MTLSLKDIMTSDPVVFKLPNSVAVAVDTLIKYNITGMPVTDGTGRFVGIISRRDIFENPNETQTSLIMRKGPVGDLEMPINEAAKIMLKEHRRHMAVVDSDGRVAGIVTPQDFLKIIENNYSNILVKDIKRGVTLPVWEETPLPVIYKSMRVNGIFVYPILDREGNFKGLLTDRDLFEKIDVGTVKQSEAQSISDDDPWSWEGIKNVVSYFIEKNHIKIPDIPARSIAIYRPVVVNINERLSIAARKMRDGNFNQVPVVSTVKGLEGILLDIDLLSVFK
ncbi:CBS domain-containing protein [Caldiplasma sukawensis]